MIWTCVADGRRDDTQEKYTHKMEGQLPRGITGWIDQIRKDIEM